VFALLQSLCPGEGGVCPKCCTPSTVVFLLLWKTIYCFILMPIKIVNLTNILGGQIFWGWGNFPPGPTAGLRPCYTSNKGPSIKDIRSQAGGGKEICQVRTRERGFFRCVRPHYLARKSPDFSKFIVCLHRQGEEGVEPVRTIFGQEGGNFLRFCSKGRSSFYY